MDSTLKSSRLVISLPLTPSIIPSAHSLNPSSNCASRIGHSGMPVRFLIVASSVSSKHAALIIGIIIFFPSGILHSRSAEPVVRLPD